jgi:menaquinone-dependent protoporphyrinogen IX oxidase
MNALIIYYSLTGMTLKAAKYIMDGLREKEIIVDLKSVKQIDETTNLDYNYIIIGGPVHAFNIARPVKKLLDTIKEKLRGKKVAFFVTFTLIGGEQVLKKLEEEARDLEAIVISGVTKRTSRVSDLFNTVLGSRPVFEDMKEFGRNIAVS